MTARTVTTWADGLGIWHASVPMTDRPRADERRARDAIRSELVARESPRWDPRVVEVALERVTAHGTAIYVERIRQ